MGSRQSSAVDHALSLVDAGLSGYKAAKVAGIALSTIYRALKRRKKAAKVSVPKPRHLPKIKVNVMDRIDAVTHWQRVLRTVGLPQISYDSAYRRIKEARRCARKSSRGG